jgi:hypothetical protein
MSSVEDACAVGVGVTVGMECGCFVTWAGAASTVGIGAAVVSFTEVFWVVVTSMAVMGWLAGTLATGITVGNLAGGGLGWLKRISDPNTMSDNTTMMTASTLRSILPQRFII